MTSHHKSRKPLARLRAVPGVRAVTSYRREWLVKDLVAGVVLTTLLVPQGMAYAELAGLPPITGLYTTILCLLGYAVSGPSRILVLGPDSSLGPMIAATVLPLVAADGDPGRAVALASVLALMVAAVMILASVAKLGFIADLISKPTMIGYMNGLALTILIGQLPKLLGFKVEADNLIGECAGFVRGLADGAAVPAAAAVGCGGIALILVLQRLLPKVPAVLVMVVLAIAAATVFDLGGHGVGLVGELPEGFPPFTIPDVRLDDLSLLLGGALGIALVSLADTISNASAFAARTGQEVRGNQEMAGIGVANLAAGLFQGFPVSTSGSRTAVAERAGARSQLTGVVGAALIVLMLVLAPGLFRNLPQPALAAVVITASLSLADIPGAVRLWRQRRTDFLLCCAAFLGVALLGVLPGIGIAVALSVLNVFRRAWWPYHTVLGRVQGLEGYHDVRSYPQAWQLPGLVIHRFDAPLLFANAKAFRDEIRRLAEADPRPSWIVIAAEAMTDVDTTAADVLEELDETLNAHHVHLVFAELKDPVRRKIERYELTRTIDPRHFFPTVEAAVAAFRQRTGAQWAPPVAGGPSEPVEPPEPGPGAAPPPPADEQ
ncbi:SulP family inorganic anion transporter [Streptomyces sp. NBC_00094]|uniref:SulP family inorganic anion transporter n=1 Tax=Streptomyces sp. NBC_00094 TaxID=2903620 RepID=UPI00224E5144|nr:sulfate permease [Streptomyces sp. NBC_00094]MCX5394940.1 sulfate permease [Streptomyces sp. NBC_00094]